MKEGISEPHLSSREKLGLYLFGLSQGISQPVSFVFRSPLRTHLKRNEGEDGLKSFDRGFTSGFLVQVIGLVTWGISQLNN